MSREAAAPILPSAAVAPTSLSRAASAAGGGDQTCAASALPLPQSTPTPGRHTLTIEHGPSGYRIIHTRPNGERKYWRRGIQSYDEALLRARVVAGLTGYEVTDG